MPSSRPVFKRYLSFLLTTHVENSPYQNPTSGLSYPDLRIFCRTKDVVTSNNDECIGYELAAVQLDCWVPIHRPFVQVRTNTWSVSAHLMIAVSPSRVTTAFSSADSRSAQPNTTTDTTVTVLPQWHTHTCEVHTFYSTVALVLPLSIVVSGVV